MSKLLMILVLFGTVGCSNKAIYDNMSLHQRNECLKDPPPAYFECIERTSKSYEVYERERSEVLKKESIDDKEK